ncbi:MAG: 5'-methylthioadenosine/adenosylhomocysteine nucleosidase [Mycoplasmatales bacterium]
MKIAIISAMVEELQPIVNKLKCNKIDFLNGQDIYVKINGENTIYFLNSGIGKVNAAITTTLLISKYEIDKIINIGTAGGVNENLKISDFVVADKLVFHDVDVTSFGYNIGQLPGEEQYLEVALANEFYEYLKDDYNNIHIGTVCTGDQFISTNDKKFMIEKHFDNVYAIEMESASIFMTASHLGIDCVVLRTISDLAYEESAVEFDKYLDEVSIGFISIAQNILENGWFNGN